MLSVTIKDTETNNVMYDDQVSVIFMQASEIDGIRSIRYISNDAHLTDIMNCVIAARKASSDLKDLLSKSFDETIAFVMSNGEGGDGANEVKE